VFDHETGLSPLTERKKRIAILGGGFGGIYTAMHLEKYLKELACWEIVIVNRENYFVYQPMLAEVVGGAVGILDTVSQIHRLLPKCKLMIREIEGIDLEKKQILLSPKFTHSMQVLEYDHVVFALGNVTDFRGATGLHEHAFPFKNLTDSLRIRNHLIDVMETAATVEDPSLRKQLLTFVIGGGGFSGTEIVAELNDFVRKLAEKSGSIDPKEIRVVLIHNKTRLMERELSESLSRYAEKKLKERGVEIRFEQSLTIATPQEAILDNGERIGSKTIISTVPSSPNPIIEALNLPQEKGKIKTDSTMLAEGTDHVWAIGDCAKIPLPDGTFCPPTAQFAIREAKVLAQNIVATIQGKERKPFFFKSLGMLGALGHHSAVAELFGCIKLSGFIAWMMWRAIYWAKLPGLDRKIKVAFSWMLDMFFPIESVQLKIGTSQGITKLHFESGEVIFHEGDVGDYLYIITEGTVEAIKNKEGKPQVVGQLKKGDFFGEVALMNDRRRTATIRCIEPTDVLALRKSDFGVLIANFKDLRETFEKKEKERR
jgi:NADH dehydrogenase